MSTKIHAIADVLGNLTGLRLTPGQAHDLVVAKALLLFAVLEEAFWHTNYLWSTAAKSMSLSSFISKFQQAPMKTNVLIHFFCPSDF